MPTGWLSRRERRRFPSSWFSVFSCWGCCQKKPDFSLLPLPGCPPWTDLLPSHPGTGILFSSGACLPPSWASADRSFHFGSASFISGYEPPSPFLDVLWNRRSRQRFCLWPLLSGFTSFGRQICQYNRFLAHSLACFYCCCDLGLWNGSHIY